MPLIRVDYTENLAGQWDPASFLAYLHSEVCETLGVQEVQCKSFAVCHDQYRIGDGNPSRAFILVVIEMVSGRSDGLKEKLAGRVLERLRQLLSPIDREDLIQLRCHIKDLDRHYY